MTTTDTAASIPDLRAVIDGRVIEPGDPEYDAARTVVAGGIDRHPAVIVRAAHATDVQRVVAIAREGGHDLAVRAGGHSGAGHGVIDGAIVLDLRDLTDLEIDPVGRTAWAGAGLTARAYSEAAAAHGLATGFGDTGSVGIGGLTTGGGIGYLVRRYGMTIDDLLAAELVTADGQLHRVDAETDPDLFWGIRGGGGNLGVVTRFHFRLHEVGTVVGGMLILPATPATIAGFVSAADAAPDDLTTIANVMPCPPMPFVPEEYHGRLVILATLLHAGTVEAGECDVAPFRALATPIVDQLAPMPYPAIYPPEPEGYHPLAAVRTMFLERFDSSVAETILERLEASDAMMAVAQIRVLGGALARVPIDATAFAHRDRAMLGNLAAVFEDPSERARHEAWVTDFQARLDQGRPGAYVNFLGNEGEARVREAYPPATWDRLARIKARYDPMNLFRHNQNVPPAA